jgi:hypothetical protein
MSYFVSGELKKSWPEESIEEQKYSPSSMVRCTKEVTLAYFSVVWSRKKVERYSWISIKENVGIMHHQEPWWKCIPAWILQAKCT